MPVMGHGTQIVDLLVASGIIADPKKVRSVTLRIEVGQPVTAYVEQYVEGDELAMLVRELRLAEPAAGGPVESRPRIVAESGPELFVPDESGSILPRPAP